MPLFPSNVMQVHKADAAPNSLTSPHLTLLSGQHYKAVGSPGSFANTADTVKRKIPRKTKRSVGSLESPLLEKKINITTDPT